MWADNKAVAQAYSMNTGGFWKPVATHLKVSAHLNQVYAHIREMIMMRTCFILISVCLIAAL